MFLFQFSPLRTMFRFPVIKLHIPKDSIEQLAALLVDHVFVESKVVQRTHATRIDSRAFAVDLNSYEWPFSRIHSVQTEASHAKSAKDAKDAKHPLRRKTQQTVSQRCDTELPFLASASRPLQPLCEVFSAWLSPTLPSRSGRNSRAR